MEPYKREKEIIYTSQDLFFSLSFDAKDVLFESSTEANIRAADEKNRYLVVPMKLNGASAEKFIFLLGGKYLGEFYIADLNRDYYCPVDAVAIKIIHNAEPIQIHIGDKSDTFLTYVHDSSNTYNTIRYYYKFNVDDLRKAIAKYFSKNPNYLRVLTKI